MSRLTRDGTVEPVSRDQPLKLKRGQGYIHFPCSADHEHDWQPYPVDPYSAICDDHTYIQTSCLFYTLRLNLVLTHGIPPAFRGGVHLFIPPITIGSVPNLYQVTHANTYRCHSLPRVRRHRASSPQGSWSNGCCLFRYHHGPFFMRPSFSTPTIGM